MLKNRDKVTVWKGGQIKQVSFIEELPDGLVGKESTCNAEETWVGSEVRSSLEEKMAKHLA